MTIITRRAALGGLALLPASAAAALPLNGAEIPHLSERPENPELIRLGREQPSIIAEYNDAAELERAIIAEWAPRWPRCPEILFCGWGPWGDAIERDMTGRGIDHINKFGERRSRQIRTSAELQSYLELADRSVRRARTPRTRNQAIRARDSFSKKLSAAIGYERECARIHEVSGYKAANARRRAAANRLVEHVGHVLCEQAETMSGVLIQARALKAAGRLPLLHRAAAQAEGFRDWGATLAASLISVASNCKAGRDVEV